MANAAAMGRN